MPDIIANPWRGRDLKLDAPDPIAEVADVARLLALCPAHAATPLRSIPSLAARAGVAEVVVKDERDRMGLGSFKALGAAFAIAREASQVVTSNNWSSALTDRTYVTASAGNHGLSVAAELGREDPSRRVVIAVEPLAVGALDGHDRVRTEVRGRRVERVRQVVAAAVVRPRPSSSSPRSSAWSRASSRPGAPRSDRSRSPPAAASTRRSSTRPPTSRS